MLAIVIPYYKLTFFETTLQSLGSQTDMRFKVYIGDDASPENPSVLLEKYKGQFEFIYHRFENNLGGISLTQQWDRCIALSVNEEWIMILGDDDVLGENVVEEFYNNLKEIKSEGIKVIKYASQIIDDKGVPISRKYEHPKYEKATDSYFRHFSGQTRSSLSEYIFSRNSYELFGFTDFDLGWHSDDKAWLDFSKCGSLFANNKAVINIRITNQSISGQNEKFKLKRFSKMKFLECLLNEYFNFFTPNQNKKILFEYGILMKEFGKASPVRVMSVFFLFLKIGLFYDGFRFLRRIYIVN